MTTRTFIVTAVYGRLEWLSEGRSAEAVLRFPAADYPPGTTIMTGRAEYAVHEGGRPYWLRNGEAFADVLVLPACVRRSGDSVLVVPGDGDNNDCDGGTSHVQEHPGNENSYDQDVPATDNDCDGRDGDGDGKHDRGTGL